MDSQKKNIQINNEDVDDEGFDDEDQIPYHMRNVGNQPLAS